MKFKKVKMGSAPETPFFRRPVRSSSFGRSALQGMVGAAFVIFHLFVCPFATAESPLFSGSHSIRECRKQLVATLTLPDTFTQVDVSQPSALCAFRPKNGGLPSFSVVFEAIPPGPENQSPEVRGSEVERSYHLVGLTDATLHSSERVTVDGRPGYGVELQYASGGTSRVAYVVQVDAQDVRYTVTATDTAEGYERSHAELHQVAESLTLPVARDTPPVSGAGALWPVILVGVLGVGVVLVVIVRRVS